LPETNPQRKQKQSDCNFSLPLKTHKKGAGAGIENRGKPKKKPGKLKKYGGICK